MKEKMLVLATNDFAQHDADHTGALVWVLRERDIEILSASYEIAQRLHALSPQGPEAARLSVGEVFLFTDEMESFDSSLKFKDTTILQEYLGEECSLLEDMRTHGDRVSLDQSFILVRPTGKVGLSFAQKHMPYQECEEPLYVDKLKAMFDGHEIALPEAWQAFTV